MIFYLHGFSSAAASNKAALFRELLPGTPFFIADYPAHQPDAAVAALMEQIERLSARFPEEHIVLIGSSLGGFYARYLAEIEPRVEQVVLINPALEPQLTLAPYIGCNINLVTGEPFEFTRQDHQALQGYVLDVLCRPVPTLVLLDAEDEIIDSRVAARLYADGGKVICYPGGSHRFEHITAAVEEIRAFMGPV